jgi:ATP-dependent Zn protease
MDENNNKTNMPRFNMSWIYGIIIVVLAFLFFTNNGASGSSSTEVSYSNFKAYIIKGYAQKIEINKDDGKMLMYVNPQNIRDVFHKGSDQMGPNPSVSVIYGSLDALETFLDKEQTAGHFRGQVVYEKKNDMWVSILWNLGPLILLIVIWFRADAPYERWSRRCKRRIQRWQEQSETY